MHPCNVSYDKDIDIYIGIHRGSNGRFSIREDTHKKVFFYWSDL